MSSITVKNDLRSRFGLARDQGARPTCLAFAVSDVHASVRDSQEPLSPEYLFYNAKKRDGKPTSGATVPMIRLALEMDGQPLESGWPYYPDRPADLTMWAPPAEVGELFRRRSDPLVVYRKGFCG